MLSVVIFVRCRRKDSASVFYLTFLSVVDLFNLVLDTAFFWIEDVVDEFSDGAMAASTRTASSAACKYPRFAFDTCRFLSAWIIVAFSVERVIAVWFPMKTAALLTRRRRACTGALLTAVALLSNVPILVYVDIFDDGVSKKCHYITAGMTPLQKSALLFGNLTAKSFLLPCLLLCALSALIVAGILRNRRSAVQSTKDYGRERRAAVNLLLVAALYCALNLPYVVVWTSYDYHFRYYSTNFRRAVLDVGDLCTSLTVMNYALNFVIYCSSLDFYRVEMVRLLFCLRRRGKGGKPARAADGRNGTQITECSSSTHTK